MSVKTNFDNIYEEGTVITAKADPDVKLVILKYYQRVYYCAAVGDAGRKNLIYSEKELIPPSKLGH